MSVSGYAEVTGNSYDGLHRLSPRVTTDGRGRHELRLPWVRTDLHDDTLVRVSDTVANVRREQREALVEKLGGLEQRVRESQLERRASVQQPVLLERAASRELENVVWENARVEASSMRDEGARIRLHYQQRGRSVRPSVA